MTRLLRWSPGQSPRTMAGRCADEGRSPGRSLAHLDPHRRSVDERPSIIYACIFPRWAAPDANPGRSNGDSESRLFPNSGTCITDTAYRPVRGPPASPA